MRVFITGNGSGIGKATQELWETRFPIHEIKGTHVGGKRLINSDFPLHFDHGLDILINNAGILDEEEFGSLTSRGINKVMHTNFVAPLLMSQQAVDAGCRHIINVGSWYGETGTYGNKPVYAASKAALHNLTYSLARILRGTACRVNCVAPGMVDTPIHPDSRKHADGRNLLGRMALPEEIAEVIVWLATRGTHINGAIIPVHGGR